MYQKVKKGLKRYGISLLCAFPFLSLFLVFTLIPVGMAIFLSFTRYDVLQPAQFVGLQNYFMLFLEDDTFLVALKNTVLFACIYAPVSMIGSMLVAWIINDYSPKMRAVLTFIFYAPSLTGGMVDIWKIIFSGDSYGIFNNLLLSFGFVSSPIQWLEDPKYMFGVLVVVALWGCLSTGFLAFVAAFRGIDESLYEAAAIDGIRNRVQELWYITLPMLKPQMVFTAITSITGAFEVGSVSASLFGNPSTNYAAHTVALHMLDYSEQRLDYGMACVMAVVLFVMMVGSNKLFRKFINRIGR